MFYSSQMARCECVQPHMYQVLGGVPAGHPGGGVARWSFADCPGVWTQPAAKGWHQTTSFTLSDETLTRYVSGSLWSVNRRHSCYSVCSYSVSLSFYISIFLSRSGLRCVGLREVPTQLADCSGLFSGPPHQQVNIPTLCPVGGLSAVRRTSASQKWVIRQLYKIWFNSSSCRHAQFLFDFLN